MTVPPGGEARYQARKHAEFASLRIGDTVTAQIAGRRVRALVVAVAPAAVVQTSDGERHLMTVHTFGARIGWR